MNITINLSSLVKTERGCNIVGELLRNMFFDQDNGDIGCYSTFKFRKDVKDIKEIKNEDIIEHSATLNGITMTYSWDGDGLLEFSWEENGITYWIGNGDCKKDYGWQWDSNEFNS